MLLLLVAVDAFVVPKVQAPRVLRATKSPSVSAGTVNLVKSIVGAGVLALPSGIGAYSNAPAALVPASAIVVLLGIASAYSFGILGRVCAATDTESYREAWGKLMGPKSVWVVTSCCTITPLFACLAYAIIVGDVFGTLASTPPVWLARVYELCGGARRFFVSTVALAILWPLCSLKSLSALAPTSALGTLGVLYTAGFMALRACDGSYPADLGTLSSPWDLMTPKLGVFIAMLGTAYMAHFNAPQFFQASGRDPKTFAKVVRNGFGLSMLLNLVVMTAGFMTFGAGSLGLILNNYAANDALASVARLLFGVSIVFTFPLAFAGAKDGLKRLEASFFKKPKEQRVVALPLALITALALVLDDVGLVISLGGALMGSAVIYILPALMLIKADKTTLVKSKLEDNKFLPAVMIALGIVSAALGVVTSF